MRYYPIPEEQFRLQGKCIGKVETRSNQWQFDSPAAKMLFAAKKTA
jgi:hypothetical protein